MFRDGEDYGGTKNATNVCINSAKRNRQSNQEFAEAEWLYGQRYSESYGIRESAGGVQMAVWKILAKHRQFYYFEQIIAYQYRRYPRH